MKVLEKIKFEKAVPNPEYLIKSIAEQGYSLETSLADLMDNSITAGADKIEVLVDMESEPFRLFMADNGEGMTEKELSDNMQFPSSSPEKERNGNDLGRFGLGMKTASFSQTRKFTVLSKKKGDKRYHGRTWDVSYLKKYGWRIIVNDRKEVAQLMFQYNKLCDEFLQKFDDFHANTIVIWEGLYKFENYIQEHSRREALKKQITEVTSEYLALVFHRFMEKETSPLKIRINNTRVLPFNPFPERESDFRQIEPKQSLFGSDIIKIEGFILPARAISDTKKGLSQWTTRHMGLMDMEGLYIYRANRIILFGGWNGIIKKAPRLQLARIRVEVGTKVDHLLHLNVAKSQIEVPHDLRNAFEGYIEEVKVEAEREYYNRGIRKFSGYKSDVNDQLFERSYSQNGSILEVNNRFPLISNLLNTLNKKQTALFNLLLRMINNRINKIRNVHEEKEFLGIEEKDGMSKEDLLSTIKTLKNLGLSSSHIKDEILPHLLFKINSLPKEVLEHLE